MSFPQTRLRRLRANRALRGLVRETRLEAADFVYPMFVAHGIDRREPIKEMPGVDHLSIAHAVEEAGEAAALGIPAVLLFGLPASKDDEGSGAWDEEGIIQLATRAIKDAHPDLLVICDLCLCEYTDHGHCGVLRETAGGLVVDNDATLELLSRTAVSQARAGADIIAPSDMMDGRVGTIRSALDDDGFTDTPIMSYSAKFASAFYGPFRDRRRLRARLRRPPRLPDGPRQRRRGGARGAPRRRGGRRHPHGQAGPALPGPDPPRSRTTRRLPVAAYNVSGEYSMLKAAAAAGYLDERERGARGPDLDPPCRGRHHHHLPREGRC